MNLFNSCLVLVVACLLGARAVAQLPNEHLVTLAQATPQQGWQVTQAAEQNPAEETAADQHRLRRTIVKSFTVDNKAVLGIDNRFGDVSVSLWDRNEIRVEITITSSSEDAGRAKKKLEAVQIDERHEGSTYLFKTIVAKELTDAQEGDEKESVTTSTSSEQELPNGLKMSWRSSVKQSGGLIRIDYRISMPKTNRLTIKNSFGDTTLPDFWAPLSVESSFGNVYGSALNNLTNKIKSSFGNVSLRDVQHGDLTMSFGDLDINSGNVLFIQQKHGKLNIGQANKVDMRTSYTHALIGSVKQSGKFRMNYGRQFRVEQIGAGADKIDVEASYTTVALPMQSIPNCNFDITVTHGGFSYPTLSNLQLLTQPGTPPSPPVGLSLTPPARPARARQYVGKVGNGEGPSIRVVTTYGDVRFNK